MQQLRRQVKVQTQKLRRKFHHFALTLGELAEGLEGWSEALRTDAKRNLEDLTTDTQERLQGLIDTLGEMKLDEFIASSLRLKKLAEAIKEASDETLTLQERIEKHY